MRGRVRSVGKLVVALLSFAAVTAAKSPPKPAAGCGAVEAAWVNEHLETLPRTLAGFSEYSLAYRKAIYRALPEDVKTHLWREQLNHYASSPNFSGEQKALLQEVSGSITQFDGSAKLPNLLDKYETRIRASFTKNQIGEIFTNLGVGDPAVAGRPSASSSGICECHSGGLDVGSCGPTGPPGTVFLQGGCRWQSPCNIDVDDGCGWFWLQSCNGTCSVA